MAIHEKYIFFVHEFIDFEMTGFHLFISFSLTWLKHEFLIKHKTWNDNYGIDV